MQKSTVIKLQERINLLNSEAQRVEKEKITELNNYKMFMEQRIREIKEDAEKSIEKLRSEYALREQREEQKRKEERDRDDARFEEREKQFKAMAASAFASQAEQMRAQHESGLGLILQPLRDQLDGFRKSVMDTYSAEARERFSLGEYIKQLVEANNSLGKDAKELTRALKGDSKVQGDWGEMILESILEKSGLQEGVEFTVQATTDSAGNQLTNEHGARLRPDVVLHYPNRGDVVIDSKVSLKAFTDYINATDEESRATALSAHVKSIRQHVKELREKRYQDFIGMKSGDRTMDFVMMFVPNEGAYLSALTADTQLWTDAWESRVIIASPTHLISVLSMIRQIWTENRQNRNAIEIAESAGKMYEKFCGFVSDMERIKKGIEMSDKAYRDAMGKLSDGNGNLMRRAEKLKELGAKTAKSLNITTQNNNLID